MKPVFAPLDRNPDIQLRERNHLRMIAYLSWQSCGKREEGR